MYEKKDPPVHFIRVYTISLRLYHTTIIHTLNLPVVLISIGKGMSQKLW